MKAITIRGGNNDSTIRIGESIHNLARFLPPGRNVIITDTNVAQLYGDIFPNGDIIEIGTGEAVKTLDTLKMIYQRLIDFGADRESFIIGIGGGIVCDITGFAASTFMRGISFGFAATTLLAQVDASVGGKNGVNFEGYKNMVGVFNQPAFVLCDPAVLKTLPGREVLCGMAEIIKHAAIADSGMFAYLENNIEAALRLEPTAISRLVNDSVIIKSSIVNRDETEKGERKKLNFGHTFGHAIEKLTGRPHGEAVAMGMVLAARLSVQKGILTAEQATRLTKLIERSGLPSRTDLDPAFLADALRKDKKRQGEGVHFVLLKEIGEAVVEKLPFHELEKLT